MASEGDTRPLYHERIKTTTAGKEKDYSHLRLLHCPLEATYLLSSWPLIL
jgi:hypothetical protein